MAPEEIIVRPVITEKTNIMIGEGKYTFVVNKKATKVEVRMAVEQLFSVKVLSVSTVNYKGKKKRLGRFEGYRANWKKAVVKIDTQAKPDSYLTKGGKAVVSNKRYKNSIEEFGATQ